MNVAPLILVLRADSLHLTSLAQASHHLARILRAALWLHQLQDNRSPLGILLHFETIRVPAQAQASLIPTSFAIRIRLQPYVSKIGAMDLFPSHGRCYGGNRASVPDQPIISC